MDSEFEKLKKARKAALKAERQKAASDLANSVKNTLSSALRGPEREEEVYETQAYQMSPEEERAQERYMASYTHFKDHMYFPLSETYELFRKDPRALFVSKNRKNSESQIDDEAYGYRYGYSRGKDRLHYYFFDLGLSNAVSITFDPDKKKYMYHRFNRSVDFEFEIDYYVTTTSENSPIPRYRPIGVEARKNIDIWPKDTKEFDTLEEVQTQFKEDILDALYESKFKIAWKATQGVMAGVCNFGLKKIFALVLVGAVLNSCEADAAELENQTSAVDNQTITMGLD